MNLIFTFIVQRTAQKPYLPFRYRLTLFYLWISQLKTQYVFTVFKLCEQRLCTTDARFDVTWCTIRANGFQSPIVSQTHTHSQSVDASLLCGRYEWRYIDSSFANLFIYFTFIVVVERFKPILRRSVTFGFALHVNTATNAVSRAAAAATNVQAYSIYNLKMYTISVNTWNEISVSCFYYSALFRVNYVT